MVKIFIDGANLEQVALLDKNDDVDGYTFNPSLFRKLGVTNYETFAKQVLAVTDKPVALEVLSDDFDEMERQALKISKWGNVNVKIPITNTKGESSYNLIKKLIDKGITLNITAVTSLEQIHPLASVLKNCYLSIFAGRIADTGVDPRHVVWGAKMLVDNSVKLIWASAREIYNLKQAEEVDCDIITLSHDLFKKRELFNRPLLDVSRDTVLMFYGDAKMAGYTL